MKIKEPKITNKTALMDKIENYLNNANEYKSKEQMCNYLGLEYNGTNDRKVRRLLELLVIERGIKVIATSDRRGYKVANSEDEIEHQIAENNSRIRKLELRNEALRKIG